MSGLPKAVIGGWDPPYGDGPGQTKDECGRRSLFIFINGDGSSILHCQAYTGTLKEKGSIGVSLWKNKDKNDIGWAVNRIFDGYCTDLHYKIE